MYNDLERSIRALVAQEMIDNGDFTPRLSELVNKIMHAVQSEMNERAHKLVRDLQEQFDVHTRQRIQNYVTDFSPQTSSNELG